jgi:hypothetical protein
LLDAPVKTILALLASAALVAPAHANFDCTVTSDAAPINVRTLPNGKIVGHMVLAEQVITKDKKGHGGLCIPWKAIKWVWYINHC